MSFIKLTERDGSDIAVDPATIRMVRPTQYLNDEKPSGSPESFPWGAMLIPKRDSHDVVVVQQTFDEVMQLIEGKS